MRGYQFWQFNKDLDEPYAWPGGYPRYFICADGEALSFDAARENAGLIRRALIEHALGDECDDGWLIIGCEINWEDFELTCAHTNKLIPSAYGE